MISGSGDVHPCRVCGRGADRPMVFRNEKFCSDRCRKVISGEVYPTTSELGSMDIDLMDYLIDIGVVNQ